MLLKPLQEKSRWKSSGKQLIGFSSQAASGRDEKLVVVCTILPISFQGETTKDCPVIIIDDSLYENEETFYVTLLSHLGSKINDERNTSAVIIAPDWKDGKLDVCNYGT